MAFKVVDAIELRDGGFILIEGEAYLIKNLEVSKTGKHGHSKCRFDAISVTDGKKKVIVVPGHERYEVPLIEKKKGQVLSINGDKASLMDLESFENFELTIPEEMKAELKDGQTVEYWDVEGKKIIKRVA
jgi:translation initiation factor 5A